VSHATPPPSIGSVSGPAPLSPGVDDMPAPWPGPKQRGCSRFVDRTPLKRFPVTLVENEMNDFLRRFLMHYGIYRRYPLGWLPALLNAWPTARPCSFHDY
jgi:hypothetical protein